MARRVFFSFHYERDIWRAWIVRNSWVTHQDREAAGFWDASLWEASKKRGENAVRRIINNGLRNTSVTVVLIGAETCDRDYVNYEIKKSFERGNGLLGIYIDLIRSQKGDTDIQGQNPFDYFSDEDGSQFCELFDTYCWFSDDGYNNIGDWVEEAARDAGY